MAIHVWSQDELGNIIDESGQRPTDEVTVTPANLKLCRQSWKDSDVRVGDRLMIVKGRVTELRRDSGLLAQVSPTEEV